MLKIRLQRFGKRNQPTYRLVVVDSRRGTQSGKFIETLGWHDPRSKEGNVKAQRAQYWLSQGAQTSDSAHNFMVRHDIINAPKRTLRGRKGIHTVEKPAEEAPAPAEESPSAEETQSEEGEAHPEPSTEEETSEVQEQPEESTAPESAESAEGENASAESAASEEEKQA